jgi:Ras-related protein Rab-18
MLVYDISNRESFLSMNHWFEEAKTHAMPGVVAYLVSLKVLEEYSTTDPCLGG